MAFTQNLLINHMSAGGALCDVRVRVHSVYDFLFCFSKF